MKSTNRTARFFSFRFFSFRFQISSHDGALGSLVAAALLTTVGCDNGFKKRVDGGTGKPVPPAASPRPEPKNPIESQEPCRSWQRPFDVSQSLFPFKSNCLATSKGRIHYFDVGPRDAKRTVVAFHGNPVWSVVFVPLARKAAEAGIRFIAFDSLGYGMSDKPLPTSFDYLVSSQAVVASEVLRTLDVKDATLLLQDGGGPIGLGAAMREPHRVRDLVVVNTWFQETRPIAEGANSKLFVFHDWSLDNIRNEAYFVGTGFNSHAGVRAALRNYGETLDTELGRAIAKAILSPYYVEGDKAAPRSAWVHLPHVRLVQSLIKDAAFFRSLEVGLPSLANKPAAFHFTEPVAFGSLKCDAGPRSRIDFSKPEASLFGAAPLEGTRAACPATYTCSDTPIRPFQSTCRTADFKEDRYLLNAFLRAWNPAAVALVDARDVPGSEYLALAEPDAILKSFVALDRLR